MPNWCNNHITITGPNKIIDRIEKITKEEDNKDGLLQFMMPMPAELSSTDHVEQFFHHFSVGC